MSTPILGTGPPDASADATASGCPDGRRRGLSRRGLLQTLGGAALLTTAIGEAQLAFGAPAGGAPNVLVTVVLPGGIDGLSVLAPIGDPDYLPNRPVTAVPESSAIQVDALFGLHPVLAPLYPFWTAGTLGAVHAVGQESPSRSHVEALAELHRAAPGSALRTGWLERTLAALPPSSALGAAALGRPELPALLRGPHPALAAQRLDDVTLPVADALTPLPLWQRSMAQLQAGARPEISDPLGNALTAIDQLDRTPPAPAGTGGPLYPSGGFGQGLQDIARLIKAKVGVRVATVQLGGWDTHANHGTVTSGAFAPNLKILADGLAAFAQDLGPDLKRVTVVVLSEFGRRVRENGNHGLDHGHGGVVLLLGAGVQGGRVRGVWPGLTPADLDSGLDLRATTDYRDVLAEILTARLGLGSSLTSIFPGYRASPVGAVRA